MKTKMFVVVASACGALLTGSGVVLAVGIGFVPTILADGTIAKSSEMSAHRIEFSAPKNAHVITQRVDFEAGGSSGWHTHPGLVVVTVTVGSLRVTDGCHAPVVYGPGQSFIETPDTAGLVENASTTTAAQSFATVIVPQGMAPRTNVPAPNCTHHEED